MNKPIVHFKFIQFFPNIVEREEGCGAIVVGVFDHPNPHGRVSNEGGPVYTSRVLSFKREDNQIVEFETANTIYRKDGV